MTRLIDADVLDDVIMRLNFEDNRGITRAEYKLIDSVLFEFHTIDAVPVKRGKWIPSEEGSTEAGSCSNCGWTAYLYEDDVVGMPYCPNCGAYMRESK
jgi:hypothetical protein